MAGLREDKVRAVIHMHMMFLTDVNSNFGANILNG